VPVVGVMPGTMGPRSSPSFHLISTRITK
jgi:hypothetical protein